MAATDDAAPKLPAAFPATSGSGPVECLGVTFESDAARREHFRARLQEKLPELRQRPDFPVADDDDILRLSDPPHYTACPNPFLAEFVERHGRPYDPDEPYHREPFAVDVSAGKTDALYRAHGYHTKVPHLAIVPSILHYTRPGDVVLDGFCGSGMTGVAAQWCGNAPPAYRRELEQHWQAEGRPPPAWGARRVVLGDLSPAATFIAANYNIPFDVDAFHEAAGRLLEEVEAEIGWMYETRHTDGRRTGRIDYMVWSEVFSCPNCAGKVVFLDEALDPATRRTRTAFPCPHCAAKLTKDNLARSFETLPDPASGKPWKRIRLRPVLIHYSVDGARHEKAPDDADLEILDRVAGLPLPPEVPTNPFPIDEMYHGSRLAPKGFTHVHHLFLPRAAHALAALWRRVAACEDDRLRNGLAFFVEQAIWTSSLLNRFRPTGYSQVNQYLTGVYYVPSQHSELHPGYILHRKRRLLRRVFDPMPSRASVAIASTADCSVNGLPDDSIDYVFTEPPFGENIFYADLNHVVESWHRARTRAETEAIVDRPKGKEIADYQRLMQRCFEAYRRVLKPGRWITVVFHNSRNAIWNAIQEAMLAAGFVVADVRTLDKKQGSYRQVTSTAVKQDLVISAYKPNGGLEDRFRLQAGTEGGAWDFIRAHLRRLPVFVGSDGRAEVIAERQSCLLFDRMVAFHVQRGVTVPLSATEFHAGLRQRFPERDGMFFLREQVVEYDPRRLAARELVQLDLFVRDEETAIQWLRQQLQRKPQTFQEIHPRFIRELAGWLKHERMIDLSEFLAQNFLRYEGRGEVPGPIHAYLSTNFKELRNLPKDDYRLRVKAKDRWYVPDPHKATDLDELRTRNLLREFDEYRASTQRRLKLFRLEAVRAGFRRAWQTKDYATIVEVARKISDDVLHEDPKLLMWYDQAQTRNEQDDKG
ncbi:MAG: DNA methyltransferase [Acidobacteria bacterium]|nr:DNA methyltransferase [Acidobacteriota bacterium]